MLDKILYLQRCREGREGRKGGREEGRKEGREEGKKRETEGDIQGEERERGRVKEWKGRKEERGKRRGVQQISTILRNIIHSCANLFGSTEESGTTSQAKTHCAHDARLPGAWRRQDKSITLYFEFRHSFTRHSNRCCVY